MPKTRHFPEFKERLPDVTGKVFVITGTTSRALIFALHAPTRIDWRLAM